MAAVNPDKKVDFDTEWPKAEKGFDIILNAIETKIGITYKDWMTHYKFDCVFETTNFRSTVFQLAIAQHEEKLYIRIAKVFEKFVGVQSKVY
jgi:hypothetical protein